MIKGKDIEAQLKGEILERMKKAAPRLQTTARQLLRKEIENCATVHSLISGELRAEFGLENPVHDVQRIIDVWVESLTVTVEVVKGKAAIVLRAVNDHWLDVIGLPEASQAIDGGELDWLRFLLLVGEQTIVYDHYVSTANSYERQYSRSGTDTIMRKRAGSSWAVPFKYAGTIENNFMTKLCAELEGVLVRMMIDEVIK